MPGISLFKIFQVFGIVSMWATKALEDGKITLVEAVQLAGSLAALLGIPTDISVPTADAQEITDHHDTGQEVTGDAHTGAPPGKPIIQE